jgi:predicted Zn-dependent protease
MILLANQLISEGQPDQAIGLVRKALLTDPLSRTGQEVLASTLAAEGRYDEAEELVRNPAPALSRLYQRREQLRRNADLQAGQDGRSGAPARQ